MQLGFYFNQTRCVGCYTCTVACKDWHDIPAGRANWLGVTCIEEGFFPNPFVAYLLRPCYHCADPPCVPSCPVEAITKREADGIVMVDRAACLGESSCSACQEACPYGAPQFVEQFGSFQTLTRRYGGAQLLRSDLEEIKQHLYVPMMS